MITIPPVRTVATAAAAVAVGLVLLEVAGGSLVRTVDAEIYDFASRLTAERQAVPDMEYVLVEIDDRSIETLGRYPWPRDRFAELVERASQGGAAAVGINVIFSEAGDSASDQALAHAIQDAENVVLASAAALSPTLVGTGDAATPVRLRLASGVLDPLATLANGAEAIGDISVELDADGGLRRYLPGILYDGTVRTSFGGALARVAGFPAQEPPALDGDGTFLINYAQLSPAAVMRISFADVLTMADEDLRQLFDGRTVVVGPTYSGSGDHWATPLSVQTPSAYVHLYAMHTLRTGRFLRQVPTWLPYLLAALFIAILAAAVPGRSPGKLVGVAAVLVGLLSAGATLAWVVASTVVPGAFPTLATALFVAGRGVEQWWHTNRDLRARNEELRESLETLRRTRSAKERMEAELNIARDIQFSMLPLEFPPFPDRSEFSLHATLEPAREVGGDFYDFFLIDEHHLCVCVADVSGKGVPAALFMAVSKALLKARATVDRSPSSVLTHVNDELAADNDSSMFVTVWLGILDLRDGGLNFTNAGHNPPYLQKAAGGELQRMDQLHGPIVAAMDGLDYGEDKIFMSPGDTLLMYTDGVPEAMNPDGELYEEDRIIDRIADESPDTVEEMVSVTADGVWAFQSTAEQADDVTIMALQYHGPHGADA